MYQKVIGLQLLLSVKYAVRDAVRNAGVIVGSCTKKTRGLLCDEGDIAASIWGVT